MKFRNIIGAAILALTAQTAAAHGHHDHNHGHHHHGSAAGNVQHCKAADTDEIAALFDRWNASLASGKPARVVANYDENSILLPTLSNTPRLTAAEKEDYFVHFLENGPQGSIDMRYIQIGCNTALDAGLYTFRFAKNGQIASGRYSYTYRWNGKEWLITSHHSSLMPESGKEAAHH